METSSIDDVLSASFAAQPTPKPVSPEPVENVPHETNVPEVSDDYGLSEPEAIEQAPEPVESAPIAETDEYGNEKAPAKVYSEDEVNERINAAIRDRLARLERNNGIQPTQQQVQQQTNQGFAYDNNNPESWQQQLETFIERTVTGMTQKQVQQANAAKEQQAQAEFERKFEQGMGKFKDFKEVVGAQPITDAMVVATRSMKDPASFVYAASKRAAQELQRISQIPDQYAQMVEIGKLEERLKITKPTSKAPKPVARTQEDGHMPHKSDKQPSIEDLIAQADAKRKAQLAQRRR